MVGDGTMTRRTASATFTAQGDDRACRALETADTALSVTTSRGSVPVRTGERRERRRSGRHLCRLRSRLGSRSPSFSVVPAA